VLPDTRPNLSLDEEGVCAACRSHNSRPLIDWSMRERAFSELADQLLKGNTGYDCLIPVSGGKDSTWQVVKCLEYGLRPLAVTWKTPARTSVGQRNLDNLVSLGVDHIDYQISPKVESRFMLKALERFGSTAIPMHLALFNIPLKIAARFQIPLVIWGENSAFEYGSEEQGLGGFQVDRKWLRSFGVTNGTTSADWVGEGIATEDLFAYTLPSDDELKSAGIEAIFLGFFFPWDPENSVTVARRHGFQARQGGARVGHLDYVNIDDEFIAIHHHPKWHKFGITRSWDTLSMEIRAGRLTRTAAIAELRRAGDETPTQDIAKFCAYVGLTEREYHETLEGFRNRELWSRRDGKWVIDDFLIPDFTWPEDPACLSID